MPKKFEEKFSLLFVCLGNYCRSPLAHGVFLHLANERGVGERFLVDSCATGHWQVGDAPHPETQVSARNNGIDISHHRARQIKLEDFSRFNLILAMDRSNLRDIKRLAPKGSGEIKLMRDFDPLYGEPDVPDPYYEGGFEGVYEIVHRCCEVLLDELVSGKKSLG